MAAAPAHPVVALGSLAARPDEFFTRTLLPATQLAFSMGQTTAAYAVHVSLCTVVRSAELVHKNLLGPTLNLVNPFQASSAVEHTRFSTTRAKGSARSMLHPKSAGRALARPVARAHARLASGALHCTMVAPSRDSFCIGSSTTLQCNLSGCGGGCSVRSDEDTWCTSLALQSSMM